MDNPEYIHQMLEVYAKSKSKEIPKELEEYISYVARTGDPVFQWSHVKVLLREKLLAVFDDFYEENPSFDIPHYPNVDPFDYDSMKTHLLNRLELFTYAPFTIQRICELLATPRKEYNRIDKYMRSLEKNILVVTSRDSSLRKPAESDNSADAILNGLFYTKVNHFSPNHIYCSEESDVDDKINNTTDPVQGILNNWGENDNYKMSGDTDSSMSVNFPSELSFEVKEEEKTEELDDKVNQCDVNVTDGINSCSFIPENELISQVETAELVTSNDNLTEKMDTFDIDNNDKEADKIEIFEDDLTESVSLEENMLVDGLICEKKSPSDEPVIGNNELISTNECIEINDTTTAKDINDTDFVVTESVADEEENKISQADSVENFKEENLFPTSTEESYINVDLRIEIKEKEPIDDNEDSYDTEVQKENVVEVNTDNCLRNNLNVPSEKESHDEIQIADNENAEEPDSTFQNDVSSTSCEIVEKLPLSKDCVEVKEAEISIKVDADSTESMESVTENTDKKEIASDIDEESDVVNLNEKMLEQSNANAQ